MASLLRSRSALQRAGSALRARVVGVRPVPVLSSIRHRHGVFDARRRARPVRRRRRSGRGRRIARPRSHLFAALVAANAVDSASARWPRVRIAQGVVSPLGFLAVWANSQKTVRRESFSVSRRESRKPTPPRRAPQETPGVHANATDTRVRFPPSRLFAPTASHRLTTSDRATTSAGRTATSSPSSSTVSRRTCRKA